jgi:hypothetical protein
VDEIARHVGLAFLCVAFAAGAAIVAFAGSLLRRAVGIALVGVSAAALVAALTSGVGGGERLAGPAIALAAAGAMLAAALAVRLYEAVGSGATDAAASSGDQSD